MPPLAYDVGMNNGDDTEYYLRKGFRVIGIEANQDLCLAASARFADAIRDGLLIILNIGIAKQEGILDFYIDTWQHTTSTFVPQPNGHKRYVVTPVGVRRLPAVIAEYGIRDLLKLDVEGLDFLILEDLYASGIRTQYISAEAHIVDVFCMLVCMGHDQFKIIDSARVGADLAVLPITTLDGQTELHRFRSDSSGPFGDDVPCPWISKELAVAQLVGLGNTWRDVQGKNNYQVHLHQAKLASHADPEAEVERAYSYWRRYPDVAKDDHYGKFGDLGVAGARRHYEEHGRREFRRQWEE